MQKGIIWALLLALLFCVSPTIAKNESKAEKRAKVDAMAAETLETLFEQSPKAKDLFDSSHGYAIFDNLKLSLIISGGGGVGVAVESQADKRIYMKMGTAGLNLGLGGQKYQVVFFFQDEKIFRSFVDKGWKADSQANAVAGTAGANAGVGFTNGMAYYQITEAGLMLQADIAGTKYWQTKKLNE